METGKHKAAEKRLSDKQPCNVRPLRGGVM